MPGNLLVVFVYFCDRVSGRSGCSRICNPPNPLSSAEMTGIGHHAWLGTAALLRALQVLSKLGKGDPCVPCLLENPWPLPQNRGSRKREGRGGAYPREGQTADLGMVPLDKPLALVSGSAFFSS